MSALVFPSATQDNTSSSRRLSPINSAVKGGFLAWCAPPFTSSNNGSSGFTVKEYSPQRPSAAEPQPKLGLSRAKLAKHAKEKR